LRATDYRRIESLSVVIHLTQQGDVGFVDPPGEIVAGAEFVRDFYHDLPIGVVDDIGKDAKLDAVLLRQGLRCDSDNPYCTRS
jgi:hypothetical protein